MSIPIKPIILNIKNFTTILLRDIIQTKKANYLAKDAKKIYSMNAQRS